LPLESEAREDFKTSKRRDVTSPIERVRGVEKNWKIRTKAEQYFDGK
jgi:hypothetical protein